VQAEFFGSTVAARMVISSSTTMISRMVNPEFVRTGGFVRVVKG
jgi:hypothetical protein